MNKAVFLDRDGTINFDVGYLNHPDHLKLLPGSAEAIKMLNEADYKVVIISNQSGVARGLFPEDVLQSIDKKLQKELLKAGAYIDANYYCPHHPEHGVYPYKAACDCRKPRTALIDKAIKNLSIDPKVSFFVGDKATDIECGQKAGTSTVLVLTGMGRESQDSEKIKTRKPSHIADNLLEAVKWILKSNAK